MKYAVTGAFGYSGKYITRRVLAGGWELMTLTNSPCREKPFGKNIKAYPFDFDRPSQLTEHLRGTEILINTYWVRFNYKTFTYAQAVRNSQVLFHAAHAAGVRRIVHLSITNPAENSPFEYFRGKAAVEKSLRETGLSCAILRPAVLFGGEDILINNIAWTLRRLPMFGVFGDGSYRIQPIHVDDLAALAVEQAQSTQNSIINAIGPETFTFRELVMMIGKLIGHPHPVFSVPPALGYSLGRLIGWLNRDVFITRDEIEALMAGLLYVEAPPAGTTALTDWVRQNSFTLGKTYASELKRRKNTKFAGIC